MSRYQISRWKDIALSPETGTRIELAVGAILIAAALRWLEV